RRRRRGAAAPRAGRARVLARGAAAPANAKPAPAASESQEWAVRRRIEDVFAKLGEKFGDLTGRVDVRVRPEMAFAQIGGLQDAKAAVPGFVTPLPPPHLSPNSGITPPHAP